ncbi:MAG: PepSY-associated TM helix domain-containing protein [Sphingobium sp.]
MKGGLRQSMAWLHTWTGLLLGWLLFAVFLTGTCAYFQEEITQWMQPELTVTAEPAQAAQGAIRFLEKTAPDAESWFITLPSARNMQTSLFWRPRQVEGKQPRRRGRAETSATLDGNGDRVQARETRGGFFLYRFHFDLHYMPVLWARYLVSLAAMFMLIAILTGVVTHKKIFVDFFMLRFGKGQRSWLDAHNVTAVFALPFYLMITYTGLVTLATQNMPWGIMANYSDTTKFFDTVFPARAPKERSEERVPLAPIAPMLEQASRQWNGAAIGFFNVSLPGDRNATVTVSRALSSSVNNRAQTMVFDGVTGKPLAPSAGQGGALATQGVMIGLHAGRFAEWGLRWLYFLSGVGGTIMVGSGLVLWTVKRRAKLPDPARPHFGFRLVERLNVATIAGLPAGIAAYFLANRLLPLDMAGRADWEIHSIFILWGGMLLYAMARPVRRAWIEGLTLAALFYLAVPLVNAITVPRNGLIGLFTGDWLFVAFDLTMLAAAAGFAWAARKMAQAKTVRPPRRSVRPAAELMPAE